MKYYIGVDGGGTKTQYALFNENKALLSSVKTGGSNHENLAGGIPEAAGIIMGGINTLLSENSLQLESIDSALLALAGIDHSYQCDAMTARLKALGLKIRFYVYNDGFIAVKAGITGSAGIGYNCGTGTCCNSVDSDGRLLQIGGFETLSDDRGGGHWIARRTFTEIYNDVCLKLGSTALTDLAAKGFGISADREGVLSLVPALEEERDEIIRKMLDIFFEALNSGDMAARKIAQSMAQRGAEYICAHIKQQHFDGDSVEIVLSGSIHTKLPSDKYIDMLKSKTLEMSGRKCSFIKLSVPPVTGCINWLLEKND